MCKVRKLHKALLRYHAPENWEIIHEALLRMGRRDLIGSSPRHLIPAKAPAIPLAVMETGVSNGQAERISFKIGNPPNTRSTSPNRR